MPRVHSVTIPVLIPHHTRAMAPALLFLAGCLAAWNAADDVHGIHKACESDDPAQIDAALAAGADVDLRGPGGQTPLFRSVLTGRANAVGALLAHGADPSIPESSGFTVMHGAAFRGRAALVRLLAAHGVPTNVQHTDGFAPIHRACWGNEAADTETVEALLEVGVPADTPAATECKHSELCGLTPVQMARKHGNDKSAELLEASLKRGGQPPASKKKEAAEAAKKKEAAEALKKKEAAETLKREAAEAKKKEAAEAAKKKEAEALKKKEAAEALRKKEEAAALKKKEAAAAPAPPKQKRGGDDSKDLAAALTASEARVASLTAKVEALEEEAVRCQQLRKRMGRVAEEVEESIREFGTPPRGSKAPSNNRRRKDEV